MRTIRWSRNSDLQFAFFRGIVLAIVIPALLISSSRSFSADQSKKTAGVTGIFSLMKVEARVNARVLRQGFVNGVSIRVRWATLEPAEGRYDWRILDESLAAVRKSGKKTMLRILPGASSPTWLFEKGIKVLRIIDENQSHATHGKELKVPLPWDRMYLQTWCSFIRECGKRYASDRSIVLVHLAGPTVFSSEMDLPKGKSRKVADEAGYSRQIIVDSWRQVTDEFSRSFPETPLSYNVAIPLTDDGAMESILEQGFRILGERMTVQGNWLSGKTARNFPPLHAITDIHARYSLTIGFQMLASVKNVARMKSQDVALETGLWSGASYFEIYQADLLDPDRAKSFVDLAKKLKSGSDVIP